MARWDSPWMVEERPEGVWVSSVDIGLYVETIEDGLDFVRATRYRGDVTVVDSDGYSYRERV